MELQPQKLNAQISQTTNDEQRPFSTSRLKYTQFTIKWLQIPYYSHSIYFLRLMPTQKRVARTATEGSRPCRTSKGTRIFHGFHKILTTIKNTQILNGFRITN